MFWKLGVVTIIFCFFSIAHGDPTVVEIAITGKDTFALARAKAVESLYRENLKNHKIINITIPKLIFVGMRTYEMKS